MRVRRARRKILHTVQEHHALVSFRSRNRDGRFDRTESGAPGGQQERFPRRGHLADELRVLHVGRVDLVRCDTEPLAEREASAIENVGEDRNAERARLTQHVLPILDGELDLIERRAVRIVRRYEVVGTEELKLDAVRARIFRARRESERLHHFALMGRRDFGESKRGGTVANETLANFHRPPTFLFMKNRTMSSSSGSSM